MSINIKIQINTTEKKILIIFLVKKIILRFKKYALEDIKYIMIFKKILICFLCYSVFCFRTVTLTGDNNNLFKNL